MLRHRRATARPAARLLALCAALAAVLLGCSGPSVDHVMPSGSPPVPAPPPAPPSPLPPPPQQASVTATVTVDTLTRFQVMSGWEAVAQAGQYNPGYPIWRDALLDDAVNELGINRIRLEVRAGHENDRDYWALLRSGAISNDEWKAHQYAAINDNANPNLPNAAGFHFTEIDQQIDRLIAPMRSRMAVNGETMYVNLCFVAFKTSTSAVHHDVNEYAELIVETFRHIQARYGWVPDGVEVILEPDTGTLFSDGSGAHIGRAIVAAGARLAAAGFTPEFIAPSTTNMGTASTYFDNMIAVPGARTYVREISYHRYSGVSDANLAKIKSRAIANGIRSAMLEHIGSGVEDLYKDLVLGNASGWQQFALAFPVADNGAQYYTIINTRHSLGSRSTGLRQYFRYVRRGAYRVAAQSDNDTVRPVGFTNIGGAPVVVMHLDRGEVLAIRGIRPGRYVITAAPASAAAPGTTEVGLDGELRFIAAGGGVVTAALLP